MKELKATEPGITKPKLIATSLGVGGHYEPKNRTYAIWIHDSWVNRPGAIKRLTNNSFFSDAFFDKDPELIQHTAHYFFDVERQPRDKQPQRIFSPITEDIAKQIVDDFYAYSNNIDTLLVLGGQGIKRAPAVLIALNEIYELGWNSQHLKYTKYRGYDKNIYNALKTTSTKTEQPKQSLLEKIVDWWS